MMKYVDQEREFKGLAKAALALSKVADSCMKDEDYQDAIDYYDLSIKASVYASFRAIAKRAACHMFNGNFKAMEEDGERLITLHQYSLEGHFFSGLAKLSEHTMAEGVAHLEKALDICPSDWVQWERVIWLFLSHGRQAVEGGCWPTCKRCFQTGPGLRNPCMDTGGQSFERLTVLDYMQKWGLNPSTGLELKENELTPDEKRKEDVSDFLSRNGWAHKRIRDEICLEMSLRMSWGVHGWKSARDAFMFVFAGYLGGFHNLDMLVGTCVSAKMVTTVIVKRSYRLTTLQHDGYKRKSGYWNMAAHVGEGIRVTEGDKVWVRLCRPLCKVVRYEVTKVTSAGSSEAGSSRRKMFQQF